MSEGAVLERIERRLARRLGRLFRAERTGRLDRWPPEAVQRLVDRRAGLIDELRRLEARRRSLEPWIPTELDLTMAELAREVEASMTACGRKSEALRIEIGRGPREPVAAGAPRERGETRLLGRG